MGRGPGGGRGRGGRKLPSLEVLARLLPAAARQLMLFRCNVTAAMMLLPCMHVDDGLGEPEHVRGSQAESLLLATQDTNASAICRCESML